MSFLAGLVVSVLKTYLANLATKQFIDYVIFEVAEAAVKSTKTTLDDHYLEVIKAATHGEPIPAKPADIV